MDAAKRRERIIKLLADSSAPLSASTLAAKLAVSRQRIVGDIALLRAGGEKITATPRGYVMDRPDDIGETYTVACVHELDGMEKELNIMVDNGCTVLNVIVEHPLYGQLTGPLHLSSRYDVAQFVKKCYENQANPLCTLTGGVHLHTLICPSKECFERTKKQLDQAGLLYNE